MPHNFPYVELLKLAFDLDHDGYNEPPYGTPSLKRSAEDAFSDNDACANSSFWPSHLSPQPHVAFSLPKKGAKKARAGRYRKYKSDRTYAEFGHVPSQNTFEKYLRTAGEVPADIHLPALPATSCGYQGKNDNGFYEAKVPTVPELLERGFRVEGWSGTYNKFFTTGEDKRVIVACIAIPTHEDFRGLMERVYQVIEATAKKMPFKEHELHHRRGDYAQVVVGSSYGVGRTVAMNLKIQEKHEQAVAELLQNEDIKRIAQFASAAFSACAPRLYEEYRTTFNKLFSKQTLLTKNFARSVFTAVGINLGPNVATFPHRDSQNLSYGWCAIHAFGRFDHTKGGHLVLYDLRLILEFPAGSLILLPSATLTHGNTSIQDGEVRASFVQFTPGGIFRFVDNGFRTQAEFEEKDKTGFDAMMMKKKTRWEEGLKKLSTLDELRSGRKPS